MARRLTKQQRRKRTIKRLAAGALLILLVVGIWHAYAQISAGLREQSELSVRNSILNTAKQCCAIEGSYPVSLAYLEENYGLVINKNDYVVTYEVFASNVMPSVVVLAR